MKKLNTDFLQNQFYTLLNSEHIKAYRDKALSIESDMDYPHLTYIGYNYNENEILNVKLYFVFFKRLNKNEISLLLPNTTDFYENYHLWEDSKIATGEHTGSVFAIKLDNKNIPTFYFYYRTKGLLFGAPEKIELTEEEQNLYHGVSCEYCNNLVLKKKYYTITNPQNISKILNLYNLPYLKTPEVFPSWIEYTETTMWSKILIGMNQRNKLNIVTNHIPWINQKKLINKLCADDNMMVIGHGLYENQKTRAVYLIEDKAKQDYEHLMSEIFD